MEYLCWLQIFVYILHIIDPEIKTVYSNKKKILTYITQLYVRNSWVIYIRINKFKFEHIKIQQC